jgi:hypothetical protein
MQIELIFPIFERKYTKAEEITNINGIQKKEVLEEPLIANKQL